MKKKNFVLLIVVGSFVSSLLDSLLGVNRAFISVPFPLVVIHKLVYMAFGGALLVLQFAATSKARRASGGPSLTRDFD